MAAVSDSHDEQFGPASGGRTPDAQVVLGTVMLATVLAVAAAGYIFDATAAAQTAVVMLPLLVATSLRTSLADHSAYVSLARRR
ncbi:hypothetical protein ACOZ4L_08720 [Haloplanus ruber]|uniref:Uncharacterized protein n=1 Tax=Haloplanus ruber TaxID=869892 RepID=A0ABD6CWM2_9EURY|nr:hypothetical protein [Haloplanus ruber]